MLPNTILEVTEENTKINVYANYANELKVLRFPTLTLCKIRREKTALIRRRLNNS